jgi:hypothetical protein
MRAHGNVFTLRTKEKKDWPAALMSYRKDWLAHVISSTGGSRSCPSRVASRLVGNQPEHQRFRGWG